MINRLRSWHTLAFAAALAGMTIGPQLPRPVVILGPPLLVAGFALGYVSALRETARGASQ